MKNFSIKRFTASLLFIVMVVAALPVSLFNFTISTSAADGETIYVLAGGDFQAGDNGQADHYYSRINMGNILDKIKENYSTMNGFIFVGDYDGDTHNDSNANAGVAAMMEEVSERFGTLNHDNSYLIEGNHETGNVSGIDATGGYDCDGYAVYLINETDFCERQEGKSTQIQGVADNLKTWLNNKIGEGYDAPIFVATHTPLGYTTRTYTNGDSLYGKYVFDVLNDAAANGLNIIFMHGHDHAYGADNYLGGEAIYLPVGDKINICVPGDQTKWTEETLNFTYMNAGYVGYYNEDYYNVKSYEEEKLTMTVFAITDNQVTVERWSKDGLYNLKSAGREGFYGVTSGNGTTCADIGLSYNTTVYASPQTITLAENNADEMGTIGNWVGVSATVTDDVTTSGGSWVTITEPSGGTTTYTYTQATSITAGEEYVIVGNSDAVALMDNNGSMGSQNVTISGSTMTSNTALTEWTFSGSSRGTIYNGTRYLRYSNSAFSLGTSTTFTITDNGSNFRIQSGNYSFYYNGSSWTRSGRNTAQYVRLYQLTGTTTTGGSNGLYGKLDGELSYTATADMDADAALAMVKDGITIKHATAADYSDEAEYGDDAEGMTWTLDPNYDPDVPGDYAVTIAYNGTVLGTAEVVVPATTTYYMAEGNGLYLVDMNTTDTNAMAEVMAGVTVYSATDENGTGKKTIDDADVTWEWVDTYNGADSGPYTVEILKDGTSLGTVEVKVNIRYETGIESDWTYIGETEATGGTYYQRVEDINDLVSGEQYLIILDCSSQTTEDAFVIPTIVTTGSGSSQRKGPDVVVSNGITDNATITGNYDNYLWTLTKSGSGWKIGNGSQYINVANNSTSNRGELSLTNSGEVLTIATGSSNPSDANSYSYAIYDSSDLYWQYNTSATLVYATDGDDYSSRFVFYGRVEEDVTPGGPIYALIEGNTVYTVDQGSSATKALAAVKAGITGYTATAEDGTGKTEIADSDLTWKWKNTFNGNSTGSYWVEISYQGEVLGTVEVQVIPAVVDDYPDYPNEGAVKVNKTAIYTDEQFRKTGVAQVELSVSGVPSKKGADVIVMLDTSSSMAYCLKCGTRHDSYVCTAGGQTRAEVLEESLSNLIAQFNEPGDDGELLDIRVAIGDFNGFNGYGGTTGTPYDRDADDYMNDTARYTANGNNALIYTGDKQIGSGAFVNASELKNATFDLNYDSGTNYDYAMDAIYQMGSAIKEANGNEDRDLYVVFMSDGAAMQWNYYHSQGASNLWENWITGAWDAGDLTSTNLHCTTHAYYYDLNDHDGDGRINEHRMANAIKGDPSERYEVIRKSTDGITNIQSGSKENLYTVPGLGAKLFSIAFDPMTDDQVEAEHMVESIATLASDQTGTTQYFYNVSTADALSSAFTAIGSEIAYAASNARFVDQMGDAFDLQLTQSVTRTVDKETIKLDVKPTITVKTYDIYTKAEADADPDDNITTEMIGTRKGTYTVLETVSFTDDGTNVTGAYSDQINSGNTNILADGTQTGFYKNVIYAKTFVYNNNKDGTYAYLDTNGDGIEDYALAPETFYWKVGTVTTTELAISYYVYLTDTLEGEREPGSYATNNFAILYYDNYLGNECEIHTTSPMLAWKQANVSYAFYLVDSEGKVIVNRETGETGTFANKVAVTRPVVYQYCALNTETEIKAATLSVSENDVLPEGYKIFDDGAAYNIVVLSDNEDYKIGWKITKGTTVATTYVTGFSSNVQYSNATEEHRIDQGYDYTHTTVWFAVVWTPSTIPDQVVIDYGLPVDISVLENDLFGAGAKLNGVADSDKKPVSANNGYVSDHVADFLSTRTSAFGTAAINDTKVRYAPLNMQMNTYDSFAYEVQYVINNETQYYYGDVTVIPATTIYYEESFVKFNDAEPNDGTYGVWVNEGTAVAGVQAEDRPGKDSLSTIDHDNVYGYDAINSSATKYSLGAAKTVTVNSEIGYHKDNSPTATFTFTGTGFDIISMTNSDSGVIFITATNTETGKSTNKFVDNYYGYTYDETNGWTPAPDPTAAIYQVPVMKISDLDYGTYDVTIWVTYGEYFDHDGTEGYSFWLDSIRIYDPAVPVYDDPTTEEDESDVIGGAYIADGESNPHYLQIKDAILAASDVNNDKLSGIVFIDGKTSTDSVADYNNPGPNNEAYLAKGQSISFKLQSNATPLDVQIGVKLAYGDSADVQFTYTVGSKSESKVRTFTTATDMYYSIASYMGLVHDNQQNNNAVAWTSGTITLTNTSDSVISLTNVKATFKLANYPVSGSMSTTSTATYSASVFSLMSSHNRTLTTSNLEATEETMPVSISFLVDAEVIEAACAVMTELYAPEPEIFVPEALEYTVTNRFFGNSTVNVITSKDVASLTVNGVEAKKLSNSPLFSMLLMLIDGFESRFGTNISANDYIVWSASVKRASNYDIVAYNADGLSSDPTVTDSSSSITKEDIDNYFNRSELYSIMEQMASQRFDPEQFEAYVNERFDGFREIITETSEDVEYVIINGKIVDRYITETVIDTETGETTTKRVWITDAEDDVDDEDVEVNVYDENGVGSESKKAERKFGWKKNSNSNNNNNNSNNGNSNSASDKNNKNNKENNGKGNSGKYVGM